MSTTLWRVTTLLHNFTISFLVVFLEDHSRQPRCLNVFLCESIQVVIYLHVLVTFPVCFPLQNGFNSISMQWSVFLMSTSMRRSIVFQSFQHVTQSYLIKYHFCRTHTLESKSLLSHSQYCQMNNCKNCFTFRSTRKKTEDCESLPMQMFGENLIHWLESCLCNIVRCQIKFGLSTTSALS